MLIYLVYVTYCKICDRLQGYKDTDLASLRQRKICLGRRKVRHLCITTTSQIIEAAAAAPAAPLSTPLVHVQHLRDSLKTSCDIGLKIGDHYKLQLQNKKCTVRSFKFSRVLYQKLI